MLKKLLSGEFSLSETFWKFGILGVVFFRICSKVFESLLDARIKGNSIVDFYFYNFNPVKPDIMAIFWTLCYVFTNIFFVYYCIAVLFGTWRSSESFDRSALLKFIIRYSMLVFIAAAVFSIF